MAPELVDLLITNGFLITMDDERRMFSNGAVAIRGADIVAAGRSEDVAAAVEPSRRIDASNWPSVSKTVLASPDGIARYPSIQRPKSSKMGSGAGAGLSDSRGAVFEPGSNSGCDCAGLARFDSPLDRSRRFALNGTRLGLCETS